MWSGSIKIDLRSEPAEIMLLKKGTGTGLLDTSALS